MYCGYLSASAVLIVLPVLFARCAGFGGYLSSNVCVAALLVMSWRL